MIMIITAKYMCEWETSDVLDVVHVEEERLIIAHKILIFEDCFHC